MIEAAGGAVWRQDQEALEVLVVHRQRYDDWTLPKGKLDPGEAARAAALREVEEETGLRCRTGAELPTVRYEDGRGRPKQVRYWAMEVAGGAFTPNDEVDEVRWCELPVAAALLTYEHDRPVLDALADHLAPGT